MTRTCRAAHPAFSVWLRAAFAAASLLLGVLSGSPAWAQTFPASDAAYVSVTCGGVPSFDPVSDQPSANGERDVIGASAALVYDDGTYLFMRMRVNGNPQSGGSGAYAQTNWHFLIDADGSADHYELMVVLNGVVSAEPVELRKNTAVGAVGLASDVAETLAATYASATHAESKAAPGGGYFLTVAVPFSDLRAAGLSFGKYRIWPGTSTNSSGDSLSSDIACYNNASGTPDLRTIPVDPTPIGPWVAIASPAHGGSTTAVQPTISGTAKAGTVVTLSIDGGAPVTATIDGAGNWSYALASPLSRGAQHTVVATDTDLSNNTSTASSTFTVSCTASSQCATATAPVCAGTGLCVACNGVYGGAATAACPNATAPICLGTGACAPCNGDFGSAATQACPTAVSSFCALSGPQAGACSNTCTSDAQCGAGNWCNDVTQAGACTPKIANGTQVPGGTCTSTIGSRACVTGVCDTADHKCGIAQGDGTCSVTAQCRGGVCIGSGVNAGKCEPCASNGDCSGGTPACDIGTNQCVQCTSGSTSACANPTPICDVNAHVCHGCDSNSGGGGTFACPAPFPYCTLATGACTANCTDDTQCGAGNWCNDVTQAGVCTPKQANDTQVPGGTCTSTVGSRACVTGVCDTADHKCGIAQGDGTCSVTAQCRGGVCIGSGVNAGKCEPCASNSDCSGATAVCDTGSNQCVQCTSGNTSACANPTPICDVNARVCHACNGNSGGSGTFPCPAPFPYCTLATGACAANCTDDAQCGAGNWCDNVTQAGACAPKQANDTLVPGSTCTSAIGPRACVSGVCDTADHKCGLALGSGVCTGGGQCRTGLCLASGPNAGTCGPCATDSDCPSGTPVCDDASNRCVQCSAGKTAACTGAVPLCDATSNTCVPCNGDFGSGASYACPSGARYCIQGACSANCTQDAQCGAGNWCDNLTQAGVCEPQKTNGVAVPGGACSGAVALRACASGACDAADDKCGVLLGNGQCAATPQCRDGVCVTSGANAGKCEACASNGDCHGATTLCDPSTNQCVQCTGADAAACTGATPLCDTNARACVACRRDYGVSGAFACPVSTQYCASTGACGTCSADLDCAGLTHAGGRCIGGACSSSCAIDSDCPTGRYCDAFACNPKAPNGDPVPITSDADGGAEGGADGGAGVCTEATGARLCQSGICHSDDDKCGLPNGAAASGESQCRSGVLAADGRCGYPNGTGTCSAANGAAVCRSGICASNGVCSCASNSDCGGSTPVCEPTSRICGPCGRDEGVSGTFACSPVAPYCASSGKCGLCAADSDCAGAMHAGPACVDGACRSKCAVDADCGSTQYCEGGLCRLKASNGQPLPGPAGVDGGVSRDGGAGVCTPQNAARTCLSGVCDPSDQNCGLPNGAGAGDGGAGQCRSGIVGPDGKCGYPNAGGACTPDNAITVCRSKACGGDGHCTCAADSECGGPASGIVCNETKSQCGPGCRGADGNGCAEGLVCSSSTRAIGVCAAPPKPSEGSLEGGGCACNVPGGGGSQQGFFLLLIGTAGALARRRRGERNER